MKTYEVKRIRVTSTMTPEQYNEAMFRATPYYCKGIKALREYCGSTLHRWNNYYPTGRTVYSATNGNVDYLAISI